MAISTPLSDAKLNSPNISNPYYLAQQQAMDEAAKSGYQQGFQGAQGQSDQKLKSLLQGDQNSKDLQTLLFLKKKNLIEPGDNVKLGDTNLATTGESKLKQLNDKNQASAIKGVFDSYKGSAKPLEDKIDAANTMLGALKSNDQTSLGVIRSSQLKMMGLNRFNEAEGQAVAGNSYRNMVQSALSKIGIPETGDGALNDAQRNAAVKFAQNALNEAQDRHNAMKADALATYQASPDYDETKYKELQSTLGQPTDQRLSKFRSELGDFHASALPSAPQASNAPTKGMFDTLKDSVSGGIASLLGKSGPATAAAPAQPAPPPAPQQGAPIGDINDYLIRNGVK